MKGLTTIVVALLSNLSVLSQVERGMVWVEGGGNTDKVRFTNSSYSISSFDHNYQFYFHSGTSCCASNNGKLDVICNGYSILDSSGAFMENGDTVTPKGLCTFQDGFSLYSQASIILPFTDSIYYVFTPTITDSSFNNGMGPVDYFDLLLYHVADMSYNNGLGKVVKRAVPLLKDKPLSRTQMMACRHADGENWWLFKQARDTNMVYKFIVTKDSVFDMGIQGFAEPHWQNHDNKGQTMFSQDGRRYATVAYGGDFVFLADFNRCDGVLSNPKMYNLPVDYIAPQFAIADTLVTGVSFSNNGHLLYVSTNYNLYQLDLDDTSAATQWYHVANMDTSYFEFQQWATIYPAPDGKLYIGNWNGLGKAMSRIDNPDMKGIGCGFCAKCLQFPLVGANNPPCMPNYALGADSALLVGCWPVGIPNMVKEEEEISIYPNPSTNYFQIISSTKFKAEVKYLMDNTGRIVWKGKGEHIDVSYLEAGVYYLRCRDRVVKVVVE